MKIFYNFFITLKRYTTSAILNILGLSLAFAAFIILVSQYAFEHGYESYNKNADRTYRVAVTYKIQPADATLALFSQPAIDRLSATSPHIVAATMFDTWQKNKLYTITLPDGTEKSFYSDFCQVYEQFVTVADIDIIEGDTNALKSPWNVIISESMAETIFPGESAIGKSLTWDKHLCTVGAVYEDIPKNSQFKNSVYYTRQSDKKFGDGQVNFLFLVTVDSPDNVDDVSELMTATFNEYNKSIGYNVDCKIVMTPITDLYYTTNVQYDFTDKGNKTTTNMMLIIALLIIIVATINYINFASSMAPLKIKMLNIQHVMGAGLWRIRLSIILESVMIAFLSFLLSLLIVGGVSATSFSNLWIADISISANAYTIICTAFTALLVGFIAGVYPSFYMTSFTPAIILKGNFAMSSHGKVYRSVLIGFQYVISICLIVAALFINLQNKYVNKYDLGYDKSRIAVVKTAQEHDVLISEMKSNNEIEDVAFSAQKIGCRDYYQDWSFNYNDVTWDFNLMQVSYNFLDIMGISVSEGRSFSIEDQNSPDGLMVFNRITPKNNGEPIRLNEPTGVSKYNVIGFIDTPIHLQTLYVPENPFCFYYNRIYEESYQYMYVKIKTGVDKYQAIDKIKKSINKIDPTYQVHVEFLDDQLNELYKKDTRMGTLITTGSVLAILISLMGVFGLVLFETQYRRKEIGIRRVIGASIEEILMLFNKKFFIIILICFIIAVPLSVYAIRFWLSSFQYKIPVFWWVFAIALSIVLIITIITVTARSWKAATENPVKSIKTE